MWIMAGVTTLVLWVWRHRKDPRRRATPVLLVATLGVAMAQTIVVAVLPVFQRELHTTGAETTWLLTAFMLASAVTTPIAGRLGDTLGYRRVLIACLTSFLIGTVLAAVANSNGWFPGVLTGRVLQGFAGGVFPLVFGLARIVATPDRVRGLVAAISAMFGVGGALGMVLAGPITDWLGTSALFWCTAIIALAALAGTAVLPQGSGTPSRMFAVLRGRAFATINLATVIVSIAMFAAVTLLPQLLQTPRQSGYGFGASATMTGTAMIPAAVLMLVAGPLSAHLAVRTSTRVPLQAGAILASLAFLILAVAHDHLWQVYVVSAIVGAGYGLAFASLGNLIVEAVPPEQTGAATGVNTILRTLGGAIGAQLSVTILTASGTPPTERGYVVAVSTFATLALVGVAAATIIPGRRYSAGVRV